MTDLIDYLYDRLDNFRINLDNNLCDTLKHDIDRAKRENDYGNPERSILLLKDYMHWMLAQDLITKSLLLSLTTAKDRREINLYINEKGAVHVRDGKAVLIDSEARAVGNSLIYAFGKSRVIAFDTTYVTLYNQGWASIRDCRVAAFGNSKVLLRGYSYAELYDKSKAEASGYSYVLLSDKAECKSSSSTVRVVERKI